MPIELTVQKLGDTLRPVTSADREALEGVRHGQGFRVSLVRVSDRSIKHHRLYFGGLVRLVADYWESEAGVRSEYDHRFVRGYLKWLSGANFDPGPSEVSLGMYLEHRNEVAKNHIPENEKAKSTLQDIHDFLKEEAGYYDLVKTPTGIKKRLHSINFNALPSEAEFMVFYKKVFGVAWRYVFSRADFASEADAEKVAEEMARMG
jgi:hypothetical protein